jgi:molecular chaperone DnaJ
MPGTDYYEVLGVERTASAEEIKKAFRRRARETHPDASDHHDAEERFKQVNEAYEVLSDPQKRQMYDRFGTADPRAAGGGFDDIFGGGMEDIFSMFFGGMNGAAGRTVSREGRDMAAQVSVTLLEAADGAAKEVRYVRDAVCGTCQGTGAAPGGAASTCPVCHGAGQVRAARRTILGTFESVSPCERCGGTGTIVEPPCPTCGSTGRERKTETVTVDIPAGVADGMAVRVPDAGEAGFRGAASGDLIVTVRVQPHDFLARDGDDLRCRAEVSVAQASLGATVMVEKLRGMVGVDVPAGAQFGDAVRVKGQGMPRLRGGVGDLVVHLAVQVPRKLSKRQRELLRELGESFGEKPQTPTRVQRIREWFGA